MPTSLRPTLAVFAIILATLSGAPLFAQRDLKSIPNPDPELERQTFILPEGFEVNLWAGDPNIAKPIQTNFDAQGRLWVASSEVYPQISPGQKATDKILVLEDTNFDGQADKTTVFADGLLIPTAVIPDDQGGAYVANSTELLYFKDTNGDLKADEKKIVLSGFGTEDTHHLLHTFRWGPDGCLYMNQSIYIHSHVETPHGVKRLNAGGIWRFRPETLELEVLSRGFVNSWGHHIDRWGQSFATDGAYGEGINYVFPGSVFVTAQNAKRILAGLNPGSPKHCGLEIVGGRHLPPDWDGSMVTCDFRAHRVCRFTVTDDGAGYASRQETEVIKSSHPAFRPIDVKMGPDGALYIADWYNPIIQHGEVDFRDERRDHTHGRIWRVTAKNRPLLDTRIPADESIDKLIDRLKSPDEWVRQHAKNMLKARDAKEVAAKLTAWVQALDPSDPQHEHHLLEALWTGEAIQILDRELAQKLAKSKDQRIRAALVRHFVHEQDQYAGASKMFQTAVADEHPQVRLEAVRALAQQSSVQSAQFAATALDKPLDRFLDFALWQTMRDLAPVWLPAVKEGKFDFGGNVEHLVYALKAVETPEVVPPLLKLIQQDKLPPARVQQVLELIATLGGPKELGAVFDLLVAPDSKLADAKRAALLTALVETSRVRKVQPTGDLSRLETFYETSSDELLATTARAIGGWKVKSEQIMLSAWSDGEWPGSDPPRTKVLAISANVRHAAIEGLAALGDSRSIERLSSIAAPGHPLEDRLAALAGLASLDLRAASKSLVRLLAESPAGDGPAAAVTAIVSRREGPKHLSEVLATQQLRPDIAKLVVRTVRAAPQPSEELIASIQRAGGLADAVWKLTPELSVDLVKEVQTKSDPVRGEAIYRTASLQCQKCHAIGGAGGQVGPDMSSIGGSAQIDYLLESLIAPTAKIKENFHSKVVLDKDGQLTTGIPVRESGSEVVLRDAEDKLVTIAKSNIDQVKDGRSLMPDGAIDVLTRGELVDLVAFLAQLGKVGGSFTIGNQPVVRRWEVLTYSDEANRQLNRSSFDTVATATDDPAFVWAPAYSRVNGDLPVDVLPAYQPHANLAPTTFLRFEVEVSTPGQAKLVPCNGAHGLALWLDGKPTPIAAETTLDLSPGRHRLTLALDRRLHEQPLRIELTDSEKSPAQVQIIGGK